MPRYFFHVIDGTEERDEEGTELPDIDVAQDQAIQMTGEILQDLGGQFWDRTAWRLEVADEQGQVLFVLHVSAERRLAQSSTWSGPESGSHPGSVKH